MFPAEIKNIAAEKDFYTVNSIDEKYYWENYYATKVEPELGALLKKIRQACENVLIQNNSVIISQDEKVILSIHLMLQLFRGQKARKYMSNYYYEHLPELLSNIKHHFILSEKCNNYLDGFNGEFYFKETAMGSALNIDNLKICVESLMQYSFLFCVSKKEKCFLTSDSPVNFVNSRTNKCVLFKEGLRNNTTFIYFPISSNIILIAINPTHLFNLHIKDCSVELIEAADNQRFITNCNRIQLEGSCDFLYSENIELIKTVLE